MQRLEFRLGAKQRIVFLLVAGVLALLALLNLATGDIGFAVFALIVTALIAVEFFVFGAFRVTLTPEGITHRGYRTTHLPWAHVRGIYPTSFMLAQRVVIQLTDGTSFRTLVPMHYWSQPDPEYGRKVQAMQQWHARFAGQAQPPGAPAPGPAPPPGPAPAQPAPDPAPTQPLPAQAYGPAYGPPPGQQPPGQAVPPQAYGPGQGPPRSGPPQQRGYGRGPQSGPPPQQGHWPPHGER